MGRESHISPQKQPGAVVTRTQTCWHCDLRLHLPPLNQSPGYFHMFTYCSEAVSTFLIPNSITGLEIPQRCHRVGSLDNKNEHAHSSAGPEGAAEYTLNGDGW